MSLPSLFLKEVTTDSDLSLTQLPQDMDAWPEEITSKIIEKLPTSKDYLIKISFLQKNEELGTATGCVVILDHKRNKSVFVPLIVKNFKLYPMDVFIVPIKGSEEGLDVLPLTESHFEEALASAEVFHHLEGPMDRIRKMYLNPQNSVVYPPYFRNVHASGQIVDAIKDSIDPKDIQAFKQKFKDDPSLVIGYEKRSNLQILEKIANASMTMKATNPKKNNIALIKKDMDSSYEISYASDEVFDPVLKRVESNEIHKEISKITDNVEEVLNKVRKNGEYLVVSDLNPMGEASVQPAEVTKQKATSSAETASEFKTYQVMDKNGVTHKGVVIPQVIDFDKKLLGTSIFINPNKSAYQDVIGGVDLNEEPRQHLKFREPQVGVTGTFVAFNERRAVATMPITIRSVSDGHDGYSKIVAEDLNGKKVKIKMAGDYFGPTSVSDPVKEPFEEEGHLKEIAKVKDFYIVPGSMKFLPMSNFCELKDVMEFNVKTASFSRDANPVKVIHTGYNQFSVKHSEMQKMAQALNWDPTNLSATKAVFLLSSKKCPMQKTAEALKEAKVRGISTIHGLPDIITGEQVEKVASKKNEDYERYIRGLRVDLTKEASKLEEGQVVDAALSLNFINSENVNKFIGFIPYLNECTKMLAQCLLASRLGMNEIPEPETQSAMFRMVDVIQGLKKLKQED